MCTFKKIKYKIVFTSVVLKGLYIVTASVKYKPHFRSHHITLNVKKAYYS